MVLAANEVRLELCRMHWVHVVQGRSAWVWLATVGLGLGLTLGGCQTLSPEQLAALPWSEPGYDDLSRWAAHPMLEGKAAVRNLPAELVWPHEDVGVDVFYVHPTQYYEGPSWNASWDNRAVNRSVDRLPIALQASAFDVGGRMYAPRYRQAIYGVFSWKDSLSRVALDLAYRDVEAAFLHYLAHWNEGRPIILAGHSQGSWHLRRLVQAFEHTPLSKRIVAVYAPGFDWYEDDFEVLKPCESADDIGCWCSWMSYGEGFFPRWLSQVEGVPMCTHPVLWTRSLGDERGEPNDLSQHLGVVMRSGKFTLSGSVQAYAQEGVLQVKEPVMMFGKLFQRDNWHVGDVNLFWGNIRSNARHRAERWMEMYQPSESPNP